MTDLKKPETSLKDKFEVARAVALPPPSPMTDPKRAFNVSAASLSKHAAKIAFISMPFTFAFKITDYELALQITAKVGCSLEDMLLLIARRFDDQALDLTVTTFPPRSSPSKRVMLKFRQSTIDDIRNIKDPLNIRSDGYLLRAPVIAALDHLTTPALNELEERYRS
jgi:hypothetical protein